MSERPAPGEHWTHRKTGQAVEVERSTGRDVLWRTEDGRKGRSKLFDFMRWMLPVPSGGGS